MAWYDLFAHMYDGLLDGVYRQHRVQAAQALTLAPGQSVVDIGCGTGASFAQLVQGVGPTGRVIGVDASPGMLAKARARVDREAWANVELVEAKVDDVAAMAALQAKLAGVDRMLFFLSLSVIDDWEQVLHDYLGCLRPGGRAVIVDVHNPKPGMYGRYVELVSRGHLARRSWTGLEAVAHDVEVEWPACSWTLGGRLFVAAGNFGRPS